MKVCRKCGAYNSDERMFCVDCNERLSDEINAEQQKAIESQIDANIEKLYNKTDPLYVSVFDKIIGIACIVLSLLLLVLGFVLMLKDRGSLLPFYIIIFGIAGALEALIPKISWELEKISLSFRVNNADDLTPSHFYLIGRKVGATLCLIICLVGTIFTARDVAHPPVLEIADTLSYCTIDYKVATVDEITEHFSEEWDEIILGGEYTVSKYLRHLKDCNFIGTREQLMMKAIVEIRDLDMDYNSYTDISRFIADYEYEMQMKKHK
ncbi:MAG: hypothetical protein E7545_00410 [Ruminococcaceae bacterium]|nr:hypothetical protein [Oscillospiraceae bacterium]